MRCWCRIASASFSVVPTGTVIRFSLGHHFADGNVGAGFEAQIAVGEDADQLLVLGDRHARDAIVAHDLQRVGDLLRPATW